MGSHARTWGRSSRPVLATGLLLPHWFEAHELQDAPTPDEDAVTELHADEVAGVEELTDGVWIQVQELAELLHGEGRLVWWEAACVHAADEVRSLRDAGGGRLHPLD